MMDEERGKGRENDFCSELQRTERTNGGRARRSGGGAGPGGVGVGGIKFLYRRESGL